MKLFGMAALGALESNQPRYFADPWGNALIPKSLS
jgi:hypothetical protein